MVQETFLVALQAQEGFRGASAPRTWLIGVLRHKVVDHFRRTGRTQRMRDAKALELDADTAFDEKGRWRHRPGRWEPSLPGGDLERREFWKILEACVAGVAGRAGEAFTLRVLCDLSTDEVCKVLEVKATNLWVLMHRARRRLRACLETTWFEKDVEGGSSC